MTWETFLQAHWHGLFGTYFFHVGVLTLTGLIRYQVLFVVELATRKVLGWLASFTMPTASGPRT